MTLITPADLVLLTALPNSGLSVAVVNDCLWHKLTVPA